MSQHQKQSHIRNVYDFGRMEECALVAAGVHYVRSGATAKPESTRVVRAIKRMAKGCKGCEAKVARATNNCEACHDQSVPGVLSHGAGAIWNGSLPERRLKDMQRCDACQRYSSDEKARKAYAEKRKELGFKVKA